MTRREYNKTVDLFSDNLYRFILKNLRDSEVAKDIVQETFLKVWEKHEDVDFQKAKSYLFSAGYRTMIDHIRRSKKQGDFSEVEFNLHSSIEQYSDLKEILEMAILKLPEDQRSVVMLRDYEGYSYQEIGEITGLKEAQVKVYIFRARKFLKEFIGKMEVVI